jgi:hypothetical protein
MIYSFIKKCENNEVLFHNFNRNFEGKNYFPYDSFFTFFSVSLSRHRPLKTGELHITERNKEL